MMKNKPYVDIIILTLLELAVGMKFIDDAVKMPLQAFKQFIAQLQHMGKMLRTVQKEGSQLRQADLLDEKVVGDEHHLTVIRRLVDLDVMALKVADHHQRMRLGRIQPVFDGKGALSAFDQHQFVTVVVVVQRLSV